MLTLNVRKQFHNYKIPLLFLKRRNMDTETGEIVDFKQLRQMSRIEKAKYIPIEDAVMTLKQQREMQVSKFDNRSLLGKLRIRHRNRLRNQPCPCGSGLKFKKCCWHKTQ